MTRCDFLFLPISQLVDKTKVGYKKYFIIDLITRNTKFTGSRDSTSILIFKWEYSGGKAPKIVNKYVYLVNDKG